MTLVSTLLARADSKCELCGADEALTVYAVPPASDGTAEQSVLLCETCQTQLDNPGNEDVNHWRCLNDSMWSEEPAVQVLAWRMLTRLQAEGWPQDLLDMLYLDDETLAWAQATGEGLGGDDGEEAQELHRDSNGVVLEAGDSVTLIKDLNVKGANFTAKRGTAVRNISLVQDNPEHIEGRVEGQRIVILTQFVKKN
ncbi:PhnA domain-containing protein [Alcanivorax sp.]|jgi:protein PhnA|uniref:PhnA domain-containing protein n=1 Tax=Alcanivorax sp. TaxID=1872427 RepID=UPI0032D9825A